jgi:CheY-like chemotaxis protein
MLATVIMIQQGGFIGGQDDDLVMRSAPEKATIRLVDDVTASRDELVGLLKQAGSEPKVTVVKATGEVVIQVVATQPVLDALAGDPLRIYPEIQDGKITVILKSAKKSN